MIERPRVLLLTNVPAPYRLPVFQALGGYVELTVLFSEGVDPARRWTTRLDSDRVRYETLPTHRLPAPGGGGIVWNPGLGVRLRRAPFDVYIAGENFSSLPAVLTVRRASRRWSKPLVVWSEAIDTAYASGHTWSNAYRRWLYRRSDAFIAYCQRAKEYLMRRGAPEERIIIGYQVVPSEQLPPPAMDKAALGLSGKRVALSVGYLIPRKGLDVLIRAFRSVAGDDDVLALVGSGPEEARLRAVTRDDSRIMFPGYLEGAEKASWYAAADLFVFPTLHDPWGLVVNEAMFFGLPIIASDAAGCVPDVVQDNGIVVPAGDVKALSKALARLLGDPSLRRAMGKRSRDIISGYTVDAARDGFLDVIGLALEGGRRNQE